MFRHLPLHSLQNSIKGWQKKHLADIFNDSSWIFFTAVHEFLHHEISRPCQCSSVWRQPAVMDCAVPLSEVVPKTITKTPERPARLRYRAAIRRTRCLIRASYKDRDRQKEDVWTRPAANKHSQGFGKTTGEILTFLQALSFEWPAPTGKIRWTICALMDTFFPFRPNCSFVILFFFTLKLHVSIFTCFFFTY